MASLTLAMTATGCRCEPPKGAKQSPSPMGEMASLALAMTDGGEGDGIAEARHDRRLREMALLHALATTPRGKLSGG
jgi:hypothetical protein